MKMRLWILLVVMGMAVPAFVQGKGAGKSQGKAAGKGNGFTFGTIIPAFVIA
jgi:hypothetical protein